MRKLTRRDIMNHMRSNIHLYYQYGYLNTALMAEEAAYHFEGVGHTVYEENSDDFLELFYECAADISYEYEGL